MTDFNTTFTKIMQLELATKAYHQLTFKMWVKVTFQRVLSNRFKPNCLHGRYKPAIYLRFTTPVTV